MNHSIDIAPGIVEQAIFTSARTERFDGYHLVASSPGVTPDQARELSQWGPAHDALLKPNQREGSVNFQQLSDGDWCISRTVPAGEEYSGRRGARIYTSCLIASPELLARFANHPLRILEAATAGGYIKVHSTVPAHLAPIKLRGRASVAMTSLLEPLCDHQRRKTMLRLLTAALRDKPLFVVTNQKLRTLFDHLLNILPRELRTHFSFSTGLRYSTQRAFRLMTAPDDASEREHLARQLGAEIVLLDEPLSAHEKFTGWAGMVDELLEARRVSELLTLLQQPRPEISEAELLQSPLIAH